MGPEAATQTGGLAALEAWLSVGQIVAAAVVGLIVWSYATGRWSRGQDDLPKAIEGLRAELREKADCDHVATLESRIQGEHNERKRQVRDLEVNMGKVQTEVARFEERLDGNSKSLDEVRRKVFNGGGVAIT